jgi:hypothetical protein
MKEAFMVQKWHHTKSSPSFPSTAPPRLVWFDRENGATRTVALIIIANRGYCLLIPIEGFLLGIGIVIMAGPTVVVARRYRAYQNSVSGVSSIRSKQGVFLIFSHGPTWASRVPVRALRHKRGQ